VKVQLTSVRFALAAQMCWRALALEEATYGWAVEMIVKGPSRDSHRGSPCEILPAHGKSKISGTVKAR